MEIGRMSDGPGWSGGGSSLSAKGENPCVVGSNCLADFASPRHPKRSLSQRFSNGNSDSYGQDAGFLKAPGAQIRSRPEASFRSDTATPALKVITHCIH